MLLELQSNESVSRCAESKLDDCLVKCDEKMKYPKSVKNIQVTMDLDKLGNDYVFSVEE